MSDALDRVRDALEAHGCRPRGRGEKFQARCPNHDDRRASLSMGMGEDGRALVKCMAGCETATVAGALGLTMADLFAQGNGARREVAAYGYHDEAGAVLFEVVRFLPKDFRQRRPDGNGGWIWNLDGVRRVLYRLPEVIATVKDGGGVYIVEGEKDADALNALPDPGNVIATTNPGGAGKWRAEYAEVLRGAPVVIVADRDAPGRRHAREVAASLAGIAASVRIVEAREGKDAADHIAAGYGLADFVALPPEAPMSASRHLSPNLQVPSDLGNAEEIVREHGGDLRHVVPWGKWLAWDGRQWMLDASGEARRRAKATARARTLRALDSGDKAALGFAVRSEAARAIEAALSLAATQAEIAVAPEDLDRDGWSLNVLNGTIDLREGELRSHRREDLITKIAPVLHDPAATAPTWDSFLVRVLPDEDVRAFLQRFLGYALTGDVSEQVLAFAHGIGANGKTTMLTTVQRILGDYAVQAPSDLLLASHGSQHPTGLTVLHGRRLAVCIEAGEARALAEVLIKQITGADKISARRMREDFWAFDPTHKIILAANHRPEVRGTDIAIWRRILLVPFSVVIPEAERDRKLPEKLAAEAPGILAWMVRGCLDWQRDGLRTPARVRMATEAYRESQDAIGGFLEDRCTVNPELKAQLYLPKGDLHRAYLEWARTQGDTDPLTMRAFGERMRERGFEEDRHGDERTRIWRGIGLLAPPDRGEQ